ncbi:hypothetical protein [Rhizobium lusitanum]|uniref:Uncharacterized protein n=1 Tax=Rhizobium lusitanum TaxID=293958 RepID=A0A1C3XL92_9HYPH|nr:hypothetical protein [Rhizobium lusitanum]SCB53020.1 hypothetical protein GA0061101_16011 [Rhizobium lusitanum]
MFRISPMTETPTSLPRLGKEVRALCAAIGLITAAMTLAALAITLPI